MLPGVKFCHRAKQPHVKYEKALNIIKVVTHSTKKRTENREEKLQKISLNEILHLCESPELAHPARHFFTPEN
ncbi:TPA: hypothetical protein LZQ73_005348 [Escherichia coli]|uniref:hypothetical protein n=1 Tax=Escherichia coli TaxID=562 RepID=UPI000BE43A75|nr:hypothetical protein [Escherichia coli]EET0750895.1 hypothetical protein [Escherichia coli]EET5102669.1 hypothetical protein [Escherichia coli]EFH6451805.1 hypothetical protein [Escherichia coli]EFI3535512.1 hypothetical protein [Escherichia coli]EFI3608340.1 hypothetical protein [Escherichia coli]